MPGRRDHDRAAPPPSDARTAASSSFHPEYEIHQPRRPKPVLSSPPRNVITLVVAALPFRQIIPLDSATPRNLKPPDSRARAHHGDVRPVGRAGRRPGASGYPGRGMDSDFSGKSAMANYRSRISAFLGSKATPKSRFSRKASPTTTFPHQTPVSLRSPTSGVYLLRPDRIPLFSTAPPISAPPS